MTAHFYSSIAKYYQHIFPFNAAQVQFLSTVLPYNGAKVLDVGCATGDLAFALTHFGFPVWAFDFDFEMIEMAQNTKSEETMFPILEHLDMRQVEEHYPEAFFHTVICFGNTLVHLLNDDDIRQFLKGAFKILVAEGKLTIQILNYNYILDNQITALPIIDNEYISFDRNYQFEEQGNLIDFKTKLLIKSTGQEIENSVQLYPIRQGKLQQLLEEAGFREFEFFGSFSSDPLTSKSLPLIVSCQK